MVSAKGIQMFVQGKNSDKCGENLNFTSSGVEDFPSCPDNNSVDVFECKPSFHFNNDDEKKCLENQEATEINPSDSDESIFNVVQTQEIGSGETFLVKDVLELPSCDGNLGISKPESLQFDAVDNPGTCDIKALGSELELDEVKTHGLEMIGKEFQTELQQDEQENKPTEYDSFPMESLAGMQVLPGLVRISA